MNNWSDFKQGYKEQAEECSGFGTYKCGICDCDPLHRGRKCECSLDSYLNQNLTKGCKPSGSTEAVDCSGKGTCICNQCECDIRDNANEVNIFFTTIIIIVFNKYY